MATKYFTPTWEAADYSPHWLINDPQHTTKEIRKEYSRLRDIAMKRANRLEGIAPAQAEKLRREFPKLSELENEKQVAMHLSSGHAFLENQLSSKSAILAEKQRVSKAAGEDVPVEAILDFNEYMKSWRTGAFNPEVLPSDAADLHRIGVYQNYGGTFDNFWKLYKKLKGEKPKETETEQTE